MSLFRTRQPFLQTNAWQNQALNALHYNTSQQGSVVPLVYGTVRQQINLIDLLNYMGPQGKKGKTGSIPITGTATPAKGGGGSKGKGGKKAQKFSVDVMFAICQGPSSGPPITIYSSSGVASFGGVGLNFYGGNDGQAVDSVFNSFGHTVNYSGTAVMSGTPMDLGQSPVIPNLSVEIPGVMVGLDTGGYPFDANPARAITDFLTNARYGAEFPIANLDGFFGSNGYAAYCQAAQLLISISLDGHQKAIEYLDQITKLTNSTLVWSGKLLKIIPWGDLSLNSNDITWDPNLTPAYSFDDDDFLPWHSEQDGSGPKPGEEDPILVTRANPADAYNWFSLEYTDRVNFYNSTTITVSDQGAIDAYGLRIGDTIQGRAFASEVSAQISAQLILQRSQYVRNTPYRFQVGWRFGLLEPMDIVELTGRMGDIYLNLQPVRVLSVEEDENGNLIVEAEEIQVGASAPPPVPGVPIVSTGTAFGGRFLPPGTSVTTGFVPSLQNGFPLPVIQGRTKLLIATITNRGTPTQGVVSVTDTLGLTWNHRWTYNVIDGNGLEWSTELWWALPTGVVGTVDTFITANFSGVASDSLITALTVEGPVNISVPFDTNASFPSKNSASLSVPVATGLTSNASNVLLIAWFMSTSDMGTFAFAGPGTPPWSDNGGSINEGPGLTYIVAPRQSKSSGVSGYTAQPFLKYPTNSPIINPSHNPYLIVVDAVAGT